MKKILLPLFIFLFLSNTGTALAAGPLLKLTPAAKTYSNGETFDVTIGVDSNGIKSQAVDLWMSFDNTKLELLTVKAAAKPVFKFDFGDISIENASGKFRTTLMQNDTSTFGIHALDGDLAVMTFKAKDLGTAKVDFICTPGESKDSNINDEVFSSDVIDCAQNINGVYTITAGSSETPVATATPVPSSSSNTTTTTTTTELPKTGMVENTIVLTIVGAIGVLASLALRKL